MLVGLNFLLDAEPDECFFLPDPRDPHVSATLPRNDGDAPLYPYLLVNIGSGVSILRVDGPDRCARGGGCEQMIGCMQQSVGCSRADWN